jgi:hypothetical protein
VLEGNAPDYFIKMSTIWINLVLKATEIAAAMSTVELI